ncbi:molybdopterin-dependent oxidoreductase (plasmid) [Azospirillum oryzae]|uniref:Molybdopterin-dependent oxidoreductase n=1 Tax=Azospirillum oryzae TaxID=286727 RepID=A0A6N1APC3_9PROT|nr:nitrate reductase [Azospirillum oryzae]KAA0585042.1 molybdopterin-dependent oxidoreductase [Azospirillum oryzae]QKS53410.1 molybdopterin-dependent oxidoreductase [Azospirillum oryzae]
MFDGAEPSSGPKREVKTTCPYCGVGCGVIARVAADGVDGGAVTVRGDADHPANRGRLCSKGSALADTLVPDGRLLHPEIGNRRVSWDEALDEVARRFSDTIARHGPDSVAFYVSGQLLTEDYYVANKLMKGFIGSANIDTNSRLCMASSVVGHKRGLGADAVPGTYEDFESADLVVLVGSNLAWCHPVLNQRLLAARAERGTRIVVVDPRRTDCVDAADRHLALTAGTDAVLFNGLLAWLDSRGHRDGGFVDTHAEGVEEALAAARADAPDVATVARRCGLEEAEVAAFYAEFAATDRVVTVYSQGVNQSSQGSDTVNTILNVHFLTGRIGRPGCGPFSVTGQPNAMGGREVGGLANQLAAHMGFTAEEVDRVGRFWTAPRMADKPGLKAVDLFRAIEAGTVKAVWIMATNPAVSMPDAGRVRRALAKCETVVISDCIRDTDTGRFAHIRLPAKGWSEKDGTVTNSDRTISRQRAFKDGEGEARADWWIVTQVARRMGFAGAFPYESAAAVFREHAALSDFENGGTRAFDIGALSGLDDAGYDALAPFPWPWRAGSEPQTRLFGDGRFFTTDGRARMLPITAKPLPRTVPDGALLLNTGRLRDQWHTMTRTGLSARLSAHAPEPRLDIHPADAAARGLMDGGLARIATAAGEALARVRVTDAQSEGTIFLPMHWTERFTGACVIGRLIDDEAVDPVSGQPDLKRMPATVEPWRPHWTAFLLTRRPVEPAHGGYWARRAVTGGHLVEMAGIGATPDLAAWLPGLDPAEAVVEFRDHARGGLRMAWMAGDRLDACLFVAADGRLPPRGWLAGLLEADGLDDGARAGLLAGRAPGAQADEGRIVCACFSVGINRLAGAIRDRRLTSVAEIGAALKAGTNCGSCVPELKEVLRHAHQREVA